MKETIQITDKLEMMANDSAKNVNIYDLIIDQEYKDLGWRLPSPDELRKMLEIHREGIGNFSSSWYMTNKTESGFNNLEIHFGSGKEEEFDTTESHWGCCCVRLVRDIV